MSSPNGVHGAELGDSPKGANLFSDISVDRNPQSDKVASPKNQIHMTTVIEWCPVCKSQRGRIEIEDLPSEDCNLSAFLKEYKIVQRTSEARKCDMGHKLIPQVYEDPMPSSSPFRRKKPVVNNSVDNLSAVCA